MPQPRNTILVPAATRGDAPITRSYTRALLPDRTVYEHARDGDWVYVRLPDGREGRVRAARYGSFIERGSVRRADMDDARTVLHEAMRRSTWQWVGLIVLALAVLVALLIVSLLGGY